MAVRPPSTRLTHKIPNRVISNSWFFWCGAMFRRLVPAALPVEKRRTSAYLSEQCPHAMRQAYGLHWTVRIIMEDELDARQQNLASLRYRFARGHFDGNSAWFLANNQEPSTRSNLDMKRLIATAHSAARAAVHAVLRPLWRPSDRRPDCASRADRRRDRTAARPCCRRPTRCSGSARC